jgi:hypothetical protein
MRLLSCSRSATWSDVAQNRPFLPPLRSRATVVPMLTQVSVTNFRCLQNVTVRLEPLTILVGPNASGKTTLLRALDPGLSLHEQDFWQRRPGTLQREFGFDDRPGVVDAWTSAGPRTSRAGQPDWTGFRYQLLQLQPEKLRSLNLLQEQTLLVGDGGNLANVFATLVRERQTKLVADFTRLVPVYRDVVSRPSQGGHHRLVFQDRWSDVWYEPAQVSDGSILTLALLALQYQDPPVDLVAIEDLEHGLHPYLMGEILGLLRRMSRGEIGHKSTQIVVATHSAELLEFAEPREVRFMNRHADGSVVVEEAPLDEPEWKQVVNEHQGSLASLWLSGGLGGVPGAP